MELGLLRDLSVGGRSLEMDRWNWMDLDDWCEIEEGMDLDLGRSRGGRRDRVEWRRGDGMDGTSP